MFKIISNQFKVKLQTADDAQEFRTKAARTAEEEQASGSKDTRPTSTSKASTGSQYASIRVATAYAVPDGDDFYALANGLDYTLGTFMKESKAVKAKKISWTKGLTMGELKNEIVEQAKLLDR